MPIISVLAVLVFSAALCIVEIPGMLKQKLYRELWIFGILLVTGTVLATLKSFDVKIPNPSDLTAWIYSPLAEIMKSIIR